MAKRKATTKAGIKYQLTKLTGWSPQEAEHIYDLVIAAMVLQLVERGSVKLGWVSLYLEVNAKNQLYVTKHDLKCFEKLLEDDIDGCDIKKYLMPYHLKRLREYKEHYGKVQKTDSI